MANGLGIDGLGRVFGVSLLLTIWLAGAPPVHAAPKIFTVDSIDDPGSGICDGAECTLREAIEEANANAGADTIKFNIPGTGVHTIAPSAQLPAISEAVTIDGYSQPGASENTKQKGTNAKLLIELSGANAPVDAIGLVISAGPTAVRGLVINRFKSSGSGGSNGDGISMDDGAGNVVEGNFIGTDPAGARDRGNGGRGIECYAGCTGAVIGGFDLADRNLVAGNGGTAVLLFTDEAQVQGNLIGTDKTGKRRLGNDGDGIFVNDGVDNAVLGNVIAFNGGAAVGVNGNGSAGNAVLGNTIFKNADGGIDLGSDGPTANDPGDNDPGPNSRQNYPVITSARPHQILGTLVTTPLTNVRLEFFASPKGGKQGKRFLGSISGVSTDLNGNLGFSFAPSKSVKAGERITATATTDDGTSEFSLPKKVT